MTPDSSHIFDRSGIASLSHVVSPHCREIISHLEKQQEAFLKCENRFRSTEYKWPRDPLHNWSRVWEYPYVYHHLQEFYSKLSGSGTLQVVDLGSGVTFFPFSVARLGYHVRCTDIDPICETDLARAIRLTDCKPGRADFHLIQGETLPFTDGEIDVVYCISVIEHIVRFEDTVDEIVRILKPGGILLLTVDLDIRGDSQLGVAEYRRLMNKIKQHFDLIYPETTIHPADVLTSCNGPYGYRERRGLPRVKFFLKQEIIKPLLGKSPRPMTPFHLAVAGFTLRKSS
jgi:SAM-dependent methyltransferase